MQSASLGQMPTSVAARGCSTCTARAEQASCAGRAWEARDLRVKSWDDLHKLWYVLLKERNFLVSDRDAFASSGKKLQGQLWDKTNRLKKARRCAALPAWLC